MENKNINITMSQMATGSGDTHIITGSLGSCVAIVIYDPKLKIGGMAHAMLPSRNEQVDGSAGVTAEDEFPAKFADEAVEKLVDAVQKAGGKKENFKAKIIGGAKMFRVLSGDNFGIGYRNAESAKTKLNSLGIMIDSEDTGGTAGRSVDFNLANGLVEIMTVI